MTPDDASRATCTVAVDGRRGGTGTLVAPGYVLTAAHVVRKPGEVTLTFRDDPGGRTRRASRIDLGAEADAMDVGVLLLDEADRDALPGCAPLWAARRAPRRVRVFGYPLSEGRSPMGVWTSARFSGALRQGWVQLDWDEVGTLEGHSGGPVIDEVTGTVAAVLVEGSEAGRFDRCVPMEVVREVWPDLPRPWVFGGDGARQHAEQRASGQRTATRSEDLFQGRSVALAALAAWIRRPTCPGVPLVVTASPGSGKSAVVARAALAHEAEDVRDGVFFHARRSTVEHLVDIVAAATGQETPSTWQELVGTLAREEPPLVLVVDALDEAASEPARRDMSLVLCELARISSVRVVVATRPLSASGPVAESGHLRELGVRQGARSRNLIDLDDPGYFSAADLTAYVAAVLSQGRDPDLAWARYDADSSARAGLAGIVAERAGKNFLVASMAAHQLAESPDVVDPAAPDFDEGVIPSSVADALDKYLDGLDPAERRRNRALLTALAYGRGSGLDDARWIAFATGLGLAASVSAADLSSLRASPAADYLIEARSEGTTVVTRLFHQALGDQLVDGRRVRDDERIVFGLLLTEARATGWARAEGYLRRHGVSHAQAAGRMVEMLQDADFVASVDPEGLATGVRQIADAEVATERAIVEAAAPFLGPSAGFNAAFLEMLSSVQGHPALAARFAGVDAERPFSLRARLRPLSPELVRHETHTGGVVCVATFRDRAGRTRVVTGSRDRTVRIWDPARPRYDIALFEGHAETILSVCTLRWPGLDHPVVASSDEGGLVLIWDPEATDDELSRIEVGEGGIWAMEVLDDGETPPRVLTASSQGPVRLWDAATAEQLQVFDDPPVDGTLSVAVLPWPGARDGAVAFGAVDDTLRVRDLSTGSELAQIAPIDARVRGLTAARLRTGGPDVLLVGSDDGQVLVADSTGPLFCVGGHAGPVPAIDSLAWPGRDDHVVVTGSIDGSVRVWDPQDEAADLAQFHGHTNGVRAVSTVELDSHDHPLVLSASYDGTTRIWDPLSVADTGSQSGAAEQSGCSSIGVLPSPSGVVVVGGLFDGTVVVCDADDLTMRMGPFEKHATAVEAITTLAWPSRPAPALVTVGSEAATVWDPFAGEDDLARLEGLLEVVGGFSCAAAVDLPGHARTSLLLGTVSGHVVVWEPTAGSAVSAVRCHSNRVTGISTQVHPDGTVTVYSASLDQTVSVWTLDDDDASEVARFSGHEGPVTGVELASWPGFDRTVVVSTSYDRTARVWSVEDPTREIARCELHTDIVARVRSASWAGVDHPVLVTTSSDGTARLWDPRTPAEELFRIPLLSHGSDVVVLGPGRLAVACSRGLVLVTQVAG